MTHSTFRDFTDTLDRLAQEIVRACRRAGRELAAMPWPAMLVWCVVLALVISILPLALFLFVLFLGLKVVAGAFIIDRRAARQKTDLHKD
jgi:Flp pilus assembly protein TadB